MQGRGGGCLRLAVVCRAVVGQSLLRGGQSGGSRLQRERRVRRGKERHSDVCIEGVGGKMGYKS